MNDTLDYKISVMQAAKEGRQIYRMPRGGEWSFDPNPTWDWAFNDYRVKAQGRRVWVNIYDITEQERCYFESVSNSLRSHPKFAKLWACNPHPPVQ